MKCPYCSEQIQPDAQKCRFCGEWLTKTPLLQGTSDARAVAKGIKKQKHDESVQRATIMIFLVLGGGAGMAIGGSAGFWVGLVIVVGGSIFAAVQYQKQ